MISSGYPYTAKTEVIDVTNGETCKDIANFPDEVSSAVGANLKGVPIICGGYLLRGKFLQESKKHLALKSPYIF